MREHGDDDHPDAAAEAGFAHTGKPCPEAEDDDFVDGAASLNELSNLHRKSLLGSGSRID